MMLNYRTRKKIYTIAFFIIMILIIVITNILDRKCIKCLNSKGVKMVEGVVIDSYSRKGNQYNLFKYYVNGVEYKFKDHGFRKIGTRVVINYCSREPSCAGLKINKK